MNNDFKNKGYRVFENIICPHTVSKLKDLVEALRKKESFKGGLRNVHGLSEQMANIVSNISIQSLLDSINLPNAFLVRSILFDKTPESNWKVPWHQDTKIPVQEKLSTKGFTAWSVKNEVPHVQPPVEILEGVRTLRIHLDPTPTTNGALRAIPGSHKNGLLSAKQIEALTQTKAITCECNAGDVLAMSPLLLHASSPSTQASHRRVIHLEFANQPLPKPLKWAIA